MLAGPMPTARIIVCALVPRFALRVAMGGAPGAQPAAPGPAAGGPRGSAAGGGAGFLGGVAIGRLGLEGRVADELEALGIRAGGALAALPLPAVADRFGPEGIAGWRLARGEDEQYVAPRMPPEP